VFITALGGLTGGRSSGRPGRPWCRVGPSGGVDARCRSAIFGEGGPAAAGNSDDVGMVKRSLVSQFEKKGSSKIAFGGVVVVVVEAGFGEVLPGLVGLVGLRGLPADVASSRDGDLGDLGGEREGGESRGDTSPDVGGEKTSGSGWGGVAEAKWIPVFSFENVEDDWLAAGPSERLAISTSPNEDIVPLGAPTEMGFSPPRGALRMVIHTASVTDSNSDHCGHSSQKNCLYSGSRESTYPISISCPPKGALLIAANASSALGLWTFLMMWWHTVLFEIIFLNCDGVSAFDATRTKRTIPDW